MSGTVLAGDLDADTMPGISDYDSILADTSGRDRRDDRQDDRGDDRDDRQDCRDEEGRVGKDKRDCKRDDEKDAGDEKEENV
jgi:hypothetical protein